MTYRLAFGRKRLLRNISSLAIPGANPTITSYNASVVKIYNAANSMTRF
jgi:hypothetical protein